MAYRFEPALTADLLRDCAERASVVEAPARTPLRWLLRRWTARHIWYRLRLPVRRRRWARERVAQTLAFARDANARPTSGPALVLGEFSGAHGLGRAAAYDLELVHPFTYRKS